MYNTTYYNPNQRYQPMGMPSQPMPTQPSYITPIAPPISQPSLLGKVVDSIDVVKSMDIPLDGSISYFPIADGTAIVCKQLQTDGTSKTVIYKPIKEDNDETKKFVTFEDMQKELAKIDLSDLDDLKDELKEIRKQLKDIKKKGE